MNPRTRSFLRSSVPEALPVLVPVEFLPQEPVNQRPPSRLNSHPYVVSDY